MEAYNINYLDNGLSVTQLLDYRNVLDSHIPKNEIFKLYKKDMLRKLDEFLINDKYFDEVKINYEGQYELKMTVYVFTEEEIKKLLKEYYMKGVNA